MNYARIALAGLGGTVEWVGAGVVIALIYRPTKLART
jgi:hypothetical protein